MPPPIASIGGSRVFVAGVTTPSHLLYITFAFDGEMDSAMVKRYAIGL